MPFKDIREFIAKLEKEGEAQRIEGEVDWNLEVGAMIRRSNEEGLPAPFFQKISGYPDGHRIFGTPMGNCKRIAIAMDLEPNTPTKELIEQYLRRKQQPVKPLLVNHGLCKENVYVGRDVDLLKFPVPMLHDGDGGRYIGTFHLNITKDLDSDWVNWGMYRCMVHNKNTLGIMADPYAHIGLMYNQEYEPRNKPMEVAIAIGVEPISTLCAASAMPYGVSEAEIAGGIRGEPVELVKCETLDLAVPANAEIVIEGEIRPHERKEEGPFGEFTGYMAPRRVVRPVIHVKAVTHRNDPILPTTCVGVPLCDSPVIASVTKAAELLEALRGRGMPVSGICIFPQAASLLIAVAVKTPYPNVADTIANVIWASRAGNMSHLIIVDDDVDPTNLEQVVHALATKCHPSKGVVKREQTQLMKLSPWASAHERQNGLGAKVYFDCTWPLDWEPSEMPKKVSFAESYPLEVQQKALAEWQKYGY